MLSADLCACVQTVPNGCGLASKAEHLWEQESVLQHLDTGETGKHCDYAPVLTGQHTVIVKNVRPFSDQVSLKRGNGT